MKKLISFMAVAGVACSLFAELNLKTLVDAKYYEFDKFSPSIETYEQFEFAMDKALSTEVDYQMYSSYLKKHYTSSRVKDLKELLSRI